MNEHLLHIAPTLKWLLFAAWILPLGGFAVEVLGGWWGTRQSKAAAYLAVFCIGMGFVLSMTALVQWASVTHPFGGSEHHAEAEGDAAHGHEPAAEGDAAHAEHHHNDPYAGAVSGT
jgi:hypothetical protein